MKKNALILITFLFYSSIYSRPIDDFYKEDIEFYTITDQWFNAWELVYTDIYGMKEIQPVDFVFFDDRYVYSTSEITIPQGEFVKGNNLLNLNLTWKKSLHNGRITLPDKSEVPVDIMAYAAENPLNFKKPYFIMPLPSFWNNRGVESKELGLNKMITGIFVHEFSHTQQMQNFGKGITAFQNESKFNLELDDNVIQNLFQHDSLYTQMFLAEVDVLYEAIASNKINNSKVKRGIELMKKRRSTFFKGQFANLEQIENLFLTMEGFGQYSMFVWLTHKNGGNIIYDQAVKGIRRNKKWWSQDEGLVLFLILERYIEPKIWAREMFGNNLKDVIYLLEKYTN